MARRESKLKITRNQFQDMSHSKGSRPNSGSIPRPNSALDLEMTPDLPQKSQMTLPRIKKPKQFVDKIRNDENSKNGTLKRERSKRLSGNQSESALTYRWLPTRPH